MTSSALKPDGNGHMPVSEFNVSGAALHSHLLSVLSVHFFVFERPGINR